MWVMVVMNLCVCDTCRVIPFTDRLCWGVLQLPPESEGESALETSVELAMERAQRCLFQLCLCSSHSSSASRPWAGSPWSCGTGRHLDLSLFNLPPSQGSKRVPELSRLWVSFPQHPVAEGEVQGRAACCEGAVRSVVCAQQLCEQQLSLGFSVSRGTDVTQ